MVRILLSAALFTSLTVIASFASKPNELQKFRMKLEKDYKDHGLDGIHKDIKRAWAEVVGAGDRRSSTEISGLESFLKKLQQDYNNGALKKVGNDTEEEWEQYMKVFGKDYTPQEKTMRKAIFKKSKEEADKHNELFKQGKVSYETQLNLFSDKTEEELTKMINSHPHLPNSVHPTRAVRQSNPYLYSYDPQVSLPIAVDWRKRGFVTPVKFQGLNCDGSYAFAGIAALEAYHKKEKGCLITLSEQNIIDCTWDIGNNGCDGGFASLVFEYAKRKGVLSANKYPNRMNESHNCQWRKECVVATDKGYLEIPRGDEVALKHAVANHGPVAAFIGITRDFMKYRSGVYETKKCSNLTHSVAIVGYGIDPFLGDYWLCKNSFGKYWGEDGYFLLARNKNNMCEVATFASFPI